MKEKDDNYGTTGNKCSGSVVHDKHSTGRLSTIAEENWARQGRSSTTRKDHTVQKTRGVPGTSSHKVLRRGEKEDYRYPKETWRHDGHGVETTG